MSERDRLPEGYRIDYGPDVWILVAPDGEQVAVFSMHGAKEETMIAAAWEHLEQGRKEEA